MMDAAGFISLIYGDIPPSAYLEVRYIKGDNSAKPMFRGVKELLSELSYVLAQNGKWNIYISVAPRNKQSGKKEDVLGFSAVAVDIDGDTNLLERFPLPPTVIVHSGHGIQAWWKFREFIHLADVGVEEMETFIKRLAKAVGGDMNATDLARIMRLPDTLNIKDPNDVKPCRVIKDDPNCIYNLSDFEQYLPDIEIKPIESSAEISDSLLTEEIITSCEFLQFCKDHAENVSEPLWYAMISNLARLEGGVELIHKYSSPYPKYSRRETEEKIKHALKDSGPHTCKYIRENGFTCTKDCGVESPICLNTKSGKAIVILNQVLPRIKDNHIQAYQPDVIGALALLPQQKYIEYKQKIKAANNKVSLADLEKAVASQRKEVPHEEDETFRKTVEQAVKEDFESLYWDGTAENTIVRVYSKKRRSFHDVKLSNSSSLAPLFSLETGSVFDWLGDHNIVIPKRIQFIKGSIPRDRPRQAKILEDEILEAFQKMSVGTERIKNLKIVKQGLSIFGDLAIWVNGPYVYVQKKGEEWQRINSPRIENIIVEADHTPWSMAESPTQNPPYSPEDLFDLLLATIRRGWTFQDEIDAVVLALSLLKAAVSPIFERQEMIGITGASNSGKSRFIKGLATGQAYMPKLVEASAVEVDCSAAGLVGKYTGRQGVLLAFDEFDTKKRDQILEVFRSSMDSETGRLRASQNYQIREMTLHNPAWFHLLKPLANDEDVNRFYLVRLPRISDHEPPEVLIREILDGHDPKQLAISNTLAFLNNIWELRDIYQEMKRTKLPNEKYVDGRLKEGLLGCLAIAKKIGLNEKEFAGMIFQAKQDIKAMEQEYGFAERLIETLLNAPVEYEGRFTTIQNEIDRFGKRTLIGIDLMQYGVYFDPAKRLLYINWYSAQSLLNKSEFKELNVRQLIEFARGHKGFVKHDVVRFGDYRRRVTAIKIEEKEEGL